MADSSFWVVEEADGRSPHELIAAYRAGVALLRAAVEGMTRDHLLARPIPGKMSTQEVVGHIADSEQFMADRMKRVIATDLSLLVGVDGGRYLEALHYQERDPALDLALVAATREQMAAGLDRLDSSAWSRTAVHTETGLVTLRQLLQHTITHLENHVEKIAEKRRALGV